jgi:hypothetical protein
MHLPARGVAMNGAEGAVNMSVVFPEAEYSEILVQSPEYLRVPSSRLLVEFAPRLFQAQL